MHSRYAILWTALLIGGLVTPPVPRAASTGEGELWDLWNSVRISPADPYQLRHNELQSHLQELKARADGKLLLQ